MSSDLNTQFLREVQLLRDQVPSFDAYPFALDAIRELSRLPLPTAVTFLVGENGSGKSTLLEAIAVAAGLNPEGGSRNFSFGTQDTHSELHRYLRLVRGVRRPRTDFFLRAESFYNVGTALDAMQRESGTQVLDAYGGVSLHEQSHGESFMALLLHRFGRGGLYLLDEPEAALSPTRQMAALARMHELVRQGSQFVIATHSPILMAYPEATIYQMGEGGPAPVSYTDTEHYVVTRRFLDDHERMLSVLFEE